MFAGEPSSNCDPQIFCRGSSRVITIAGFLQKKLKEL
jgi:hypothetical protein